MIEILVFLLLLGLLFLALPWPINWLARRFHADRSGYGTVAVAIAASLVIGLLIQIFLSTLVDWPIILATNFVIDAAIFTFLLGTSIIGGLIITVFENLIGAALLAAAIAALSAMGLGGVIISDSMMIMSGAAPQKSSIESYADAVCDCQKDKSCLQDRFAELVFMASQADDQGPGSEAHKQTLRARLCVNSGHRESKRRLPESGLADRGNDAGSAPTPPAAPTATPATTATPTLPLPAATPQSTPQQAATAAATVNPAIGVAQPRRSRWTFSEVPSADINNYINKQARITRKDNGSIVSGVLTRSQRSSAIALEQQRYGGVFVMYIPKAQIRTLEIRTLTPR